MSAPVKARRPGAAVQRKPLVPLWRAPATVACRGADTLLFYKRERAEGEDYAEYLEAEEARTWRAKALCARCPFASDCLEHAMGEEKTGGRYGIRGGKTPDERAQLQKTRTRRQSRQRAREEAAA